MLSCSVLFCHSDKGYPKIYLESFFDIKSFGFYVGDMNLGTIPYCIGPIL